MTTLATRHAVAYGSLIGNRVKGRDMPRGGRRPGAGRKPGSVSRMTQLAREKAASTGELPHEFLLRVARGDAVDGAVPTLAQRIDAAKAAAPYYAPRLAALEHSCGERGPVLDRGIGQVVIHLPDNGRRVFDALPLSSVPEV